MMDTPAQDCHQPHLYDRPKEPSAFGTYNTMSGPFFDPAEEPKHSSTKPRKPSDWERDDIIPDGWGKNAPINVGRQGRRKAKERLGKQLRALSDDEDDWFRNPKKTRSDHTRDGNAPRQRGDSSSNHKRPAFALSIRSDSYVPESSAQSQNHSRPGLLDRLRPRNPDAVQKDRSSKSHRDDERDRPRWNQDRHLREVDDRDLYGMDNRNFRGMDDRDFREADDSKFSRRSDGRVRGERDRDSRSHRDRDAREWNNRGLLDRIRDPHDGRTDVRQNQRGPRYKGGYHNNRP
jgi:protein AIR1/2